MKDLINEFKEIFVASFKVMFNKKLVGPKNRLKASLNCLLFSVITLFIVGQLCITTARYTYLSICISGSEIHGKSTNWTYKADTEKYSNYTSAKNDLINKNNLATAISNLNGNLAKKLIQYTILLIGDLSIIIILHFIMICLYNVFISLDMNHLIENKDSSYYISKRNNFLEKYDSDIYTSREMVRDCYYPCFYKDEQVLKLLSYKKFDEMLLY